VSRPFFVTNLRMDTPGQGEGDEDDGSFGAPSVRGRPSPRAAVAAVSGGGGSIESSLNQMRADHVRERLRKAAQGTPADGDEARPKRPVIESPWLQIASEFQCC
jgi:hypothetical protein